MFFPYWMGRALPASILEEYWIFGKRREDCMESRGGEKGGRKKGIKGMKWNVWSKRRRVFPRRKRCARCPTGSSRKYEGTEKKRVFEKLCKFKACEKKRTFLRRSNAERQTEQLERVP